MTRVEWLSTEEVGREIGRTGEWVRQEIVAGRLVAAYFDGRGRRTYRVRRTDLRRYLSLYMRETGPEDEAAR